MGTPLKTSPVAPPSLGICELARKLAIQRVGYSPFGWNGGDSSAPLERQLVEANRKRFKATAEYYYILDRVARGEQP